MKKVTIRYVKFLKKRCIDQTNGYVLSTVSLALAIWSLSVSSEGAIFWVDTSIISHKIA